MPTPANSINEATTGIAGFTGTAFTATAVTAHNILIGGATSSAITQASPSATSGVPVISQGSSSDPIFGTAVVAGGGTGQVTLTNHGVLVGAGTSAISQTAAGTAGQVLQSGGASADPVYSTATYPSTAGTSGNLLQSNGTNFVSTAPIMLLSANVTLTSSQIKNLHGTPIQVVAAPSAGQILNVVSFASKFLYGGNNAFTAGAGQVIGLYYGNLTVVPQTVLSNAVLTGTSTRWSYGLPNSGNTTTTDITASSFVLYNPVATEISGNANNDNTFEITVLYYIWTL